MFLLAQEITHRHNQVAGQQSIELTLVCSCAALMPKRIKFSSPLRIRAFKASAPANLSVHALTMLSQSAKECTLITLLQQSMIHRTGLKRHICLESKVYHTYCHICILIHAVYIKTGIEEEESVKTLRNKSSATRSTSDLPAFGPQRTTVCLLIRHAKLARKPQHRRHPSQKRNVLIHDAKAPVWLAKGRISSALRWPVWLRFNAAKTFWISCVRSSVSLASGIICHKRGC